MNYLLLGLGVSNLAAQRLLEWQGEEFAVFDERDANSSTIELEEVEKLSNTKVILSPGFPRSSALVQKLLFNQCQLLNEMDLASHFLEDEVLIGVSASVGKSSFCSFLFQLLEEGGKEAFLGGNFGVPLCEYVLQKLQGRRSKAEFLVLELSSYQLETLQTRFHYAFLLNFFPNHADRYPQLEAYYDAKMNLIELSQKTFVLKPGGELWKHFLKRKNTKETFCYEEDLLYQEIESFQLENIVAKHNQVYLALALTFLKRVHVLKQVSLEQLKKICPLEHRLELFHTPSLSCVNDSKSTSLSGVRAAIEECKESFPSKNLLLLLGGLNKGHDWKQLSSYFKENSLRFWAFGASGGQIKDQLPSVLGVSPSLGEALNNVLPMLGEDDLLLLSPGGASHDEFGSFEERGVFFKNYVVQYFSQRK